MTGIGIRVESLGKRYRIAATGERRLGRPRRRPLWALRGVSFEAPRGTTVGVIGRNGAGKTTLLKVLSRITPPTEGRVVLPRRTSALLEVGTGFHPELTGRENVYLNGAILGMRRREIARKFDEIVAFAEIEEFIDAPVKRYSSGMSLRLAFAVAAHLEPDVLLVDEVLAVGDASFQSKCLGKMDEVTGQGRTVVLVSHSMPTIASLADRCLWLDRGEIVAEGVTADVIRRYLASALPADPGAAADLSGRERPREHPGPRELFLRSITLLDANGAPSRSFYEGDPIGVEVGFEVTRPLGWVELRCYVNTIEGVWLFAANSGKRRRDLDPGYYTTATTFAPNHLRPGSYTIDLGMQSAVPQDMVPDAIRFEIESSLEGYDDPAWAGSMGLVRFDYSWSDPEPVVRE
ncbi:MAG TPA: ABC transporter ATP-binding protein [Gaiellaceae bacterium]|nr:ABC transporter ATP-binding protein [Gaiellaceae bacterium]